MNIIKYLKEYNKRRREKSEISKMVKELGIVTDESVESIEDILCVDYTVGK